jgi:hypothetical protein
MKRTFASLIAMIALLLGSAAQAQENALPGLEIQLKNADGKVVKTCITGDDGSWSFDNLDAGEYTINIETAKITKSRSNIQNNRLAAAKLKAKEKANRTVSTASTDADSDGDTAEELRFTLNFNEISYGVKSPRDVATGQSSGKRTHKPVTFVKEWGASTPMLFNVTKSAGSISGIGTWDLALQKK